jgi:hypothetical protein
MAKPNPCSRCGSTEIEVHIEPDDPVTGPSQYVAAFCKCGNRGRAAGYMKDCGMEDETEEEWAVWYWNQDNPPLQET